MAGWRIEKERPEYFTGRAAAALPESAAAYPVILCRGTSHGEWADVGSLFRREVLEAAGVVVAATVFGPERLLFPRGDWRAIGAELAELLEQGTFHVLCHSHGLQVAAIAAAKASAASLVSVSGPIRRELRETYLSAAAHCDQVLQLADAGTDMTQILGQVFGRSAPAVAAVAAPAKLARLRSRDFPAAPNVENVRLPGIGHSGLLYEERFFDLARQWIVPALTMMETTR